MITILLASCQVKNNTYTLDNIFDNRTHPFLIEHKPIQNPEGSKFHMDVNFRKSYDMYKKRTQNNELDQNQDIDLIINNIDEFSIYKLIGAKTTNTNDADWKTDHIKASLSKKINKRSHYYDRNIERNNKNILNINYYNNKTQKNSKKQHLRYSYRSRAKCVPQ